MTSIYSVDFIGTIIKYNDTKAIIPTGKRTFYEKLGESGIAFSDDVRFARMRDKGHVTVRPKWYALLFRFVWFVVSIVVGVGAVTDAAFANMGKYIAKTPFVKTATEAFSTTRMGNAINKVSSKADRYYKSAMTRARNYGTEVHGKTVVNGIVSQGKKN